MLPMHVKLVCDCVRYVEFVDYAPIFLIINIVQ